METIRRITKLFAILLLFSIIFSIPLVPIQGQRSDRGESSEIIFIGKEETKWTEKREIPLPVIMGQGVKGEPQMSTLDLGEGGIGPMKKMSPSTTEPGCTYRSRLTRDVAGVFVGDKALFEKGRFFYYERNYGDAIQTLQKVGQGDPASPWRGSALYWIGEAKYHLGEREEAFTYYRRVAEEYPRNEFFPYALYSCGWIQLQKGRWEEGSRFFHRVYESTPNHPIVQSSLFWSGYCLYELGRYPEVIRELKTLLQDYPRSVWRPEGEYLMGLGYFRLRQFGEARERFEGFSKRYPQHPLDESARYALAWTFISLGQYAEGRKVFEEILLAFPSTALSDPIFWGILRTYLGADQVEKAIYFYQRFISFFLSPAWSEQCLFDIGQYYFDKKEFSSATPTFRQFLRTFPEGDLQEWASFMLGESLFNQKEYGRAIESYRQVLEEKRKASLEHRIYGKLGYAYFHLKDYDEALRSWEKLLTDFPETAERNEILYWMAEASLLKQDYRRAVGYVDRLAGDPRFYPKGLTGLGWYHFHRREWKESNVYFLKVLTEYPRYESKPSVSLLVGENYLNQNDYERAKTHLAPLAALPETHEDREKALYLLGWIAYREERFDDAIDIFQALLASYPGSGYGAESYYWIAWSHFRKKSFEKAIAEFQWLLQGYPRSPWVPSSLLKMGDARYNLKQYGQAAQVYQQVAKEHPNSKEAPEADFGVLLCLLQEKKFDLFAARAEGFVKRYPQHPLASQALMQLGDHYQQSGMVEKALKTYRELIHLYPSSEWAEEAEFRTVVLLRKERRWTEAIDVMEKFIRRYPKSHLTSDAYVELGDLYYLLKDYPRALDKYEWLIKNHPQHRLVKGVYLAMEDAYRNLGRTEEAEKVMKDLIARFQQEDVRYDGYLRLGLLYLTQRKFSDAIAALSQAARSPDEGVAGQAQVKLGEAYLGTENREMAVVQFSRVIYLYPNQPEVLEESLVKLGTLYMEEKKFPEAKQVYLKLLERTRREDRRELAKRMLDQIP